MFAFVVDGEIRLPHKLLSSSPVYFYVESTQRVQLIFLCYLPLTKKEINSCDEEKQTEINSCDQEKQTNGNCSNYMILYSMRIVITTTSFPSIFFFLIISYFFLKFESKVPMEEKP